MPSMVSAACFQLLARGPKRPQEFSMSLTKVLGSLKKGLLERATGPHKGWICILGSDVVPGISPSPLSELCDSVLKVA